MLYSSQIHTPLGDMLAISDHQVLHLLEFQDRPHLHSRVDKLCASKKEMVQPGKTEVTHALENQLALYFRGKIKTFEVPINPIGSNFQKNVWRALMDIPYGETRSYSQQARHIGNLNARRAVANANASNLLAIIIPCHRVIRHDGSLGGYGGHPTRKQWLLAHEKNTCSGDTNLP